jgi:hypothetical protein
VKLIFNLAATIAVLVSTSLARASTIDTLKCSATEKSHQILVTRVDASHFKAEDYVTIDAPGAPGGYQYYELEGKLEADLVDLSYVDRGVRMPFLRGLGRTLFAFGSLPVSCL